MFAKMFEHNKYGQIVAMRDDKIIRISFDNQGVEVFHINMDYPTAQAAQSALKIVDRAELASVIREAINQLGRKYGNDIHEGSQQSVQEDNDREQGDTPSDSSEHGNAGDGVPSVGRSDRQGDPTF